MATTLNLEQMKQFVRDHFEDFVNNGILAPAVTGYIVSRTGSFFWPFAITTVVAVLGSLSWIFVIGSVKQIVWAQPKGSNLAQAAGTA